MDTAYVRETYSQNSLNMVPEHAGGSIVPKKSRFNAQLVWQNSIESNTLQGTKIDPENRLSKNKTSIPTIHFQVLC